MIPASLQTNADLGLWVSFPAPGKVRVAFGKVEYGQGISTALAQIAAEELDVALDRLVVANAATGAVPDEGLTVGSMSIETSGASVRAAAAEVRALFLAEAAARLGSDPQALDVVDGAFLAGGAPCGLDYWTLAGAVDLARPATGTVRWKTPDRHRLVGVDTPRLDLPAKVFGAAFLHDRPFPDVIHARVLRQPGPGATLAALDRDAVRRAAGAEVDILVEGAFIAFLSASEPAAAAALDAAERLVRWEGARAVSPALSAPASLKTLPATTWSEGAPAPEVSNRRRLTAVYGRPYISHGSIGPACGVARFEAGALTVWTHAQGVYPLRAMLARLTGLAPEAIGVEHAQGAGCYGHNGSDDAACDAAVIAVARPGRTIRVQWRREDEFAWAPVGTAMMIELAGEIDASGRLVDYSTEIWSGPHVGRGFALAQTALHPAAPPPTPISIPGFSGGRLNAVPSYDIALARVTEHTVAAPIRTSSLRGLGGPVNTFAGEGFVDEVADLAGADPLAYRLGMLSDPRGRAVLGRLGEMAHWEGRGPAGSGAGLGLAYVRHRDRGAYVAVAVALEVEAEVRLTRMWCAADLGLVINPDGARNQIEGGMIMAASWALKEEVRLGESGIVSRAWADYPILRFDEVPPVEVELMDQPTSAPLGAGEISLGPTLAAIGNALAHALGARIRVLPFTRERIAERLVGD